VDAPVDILYSSDGRRRVAVFQRADGLFGYQEQYVHNSAVVGERWVPLYTGASLYDTLETARRELVFNVAWLARRAHGET